MALVLGFGGSEAQFFSLAHALAAFVGTGTGLTIARLHTRPPLWRLAVASFCGVSVGYGLFAILSPVGLIDVGNLVREASIIFVALMLGFGVSRISAGPAIPRRPVRRRPSWRRR
ncbi:hypothetical protein [Lentisalinibacter orientalis]|uniref:hypothetical protein n=1 Tax=Lentisalinibacter orientalis TaxID=2992241 RepID=UPI0038673155